MDCQRFETLLSDQLAGRLAPQVAEAAKRHLEECAGCARLAGEVRRLREEMAALPQLTVRRELIERILESTSGLRRRGSLWHDLLQPTLTPFFTQRFAFATLIMFVFISVMVNVMGPEFSAYSRNPSLLMEKADQVSTSVYGAWRRFNDFRSRVVDEVILFKDDLFGRLDYHLITLLVREYEAEPQPAAERPAGEGQENDQNKQNEVGQENE